MTLVLIIFALAGLQGAAAARHIPSITPAKPGESNMRPGCENEHASCSEWAESGECENNPGYMHNYCRKACEACVIADAGDDAPLAASTAAVASVSRGGRKVASADVVRRATVLAGKGEAIRHTDEPGAKIYFHKAVKLAPNKLALLQLGRMGIHNQEAGARAEAYAHLERAFDEDCFPEPVDINSIQGYYLANIIARYHMKMYEGRATKKWLALAASSSSRTNECTNMAAAAFITAYSESAEAAVAMFTEYHREMNRLLAMPSLGMEQFNEDEDPFQFCLSSTFYHEVYLDADLRNSTSKFYQLAVKAWPHFNYVAPHLLNKEKQTKKPKKGKRIKLGVASAMFGPSSVTSDFGETMARLPRGVFEVVYVDVRDLRPLESPYLLQRAAQGDQVIEIKLAYNEKAWLHEARRAIAALKLDVLLYLDLTMSNKIQRLAMSRLAAVQATSHGHPVTSGIDASVMNYFVSWGAAELPLEEAQKHYTEKLLLLPANALHQYYTPLISKSGVSTVTGMSFKHLTRAVLARDFKVPAAGNWYLCMQKPFKRHPLFDELIAGVLANDLAGHVLLHDLYNESEEHREIIHGRLARAGVDLRRVHFVPTLPHHVLMAFYDQADVVLDSYSAGGCTTTREAIEAGAAVVTLPAAYLGGRWSLAYFAQIGVLDTVAKDAADYVRIAVTLGTDKVEQARVRALVKTNAHKLFHRTEAVNAWSRLLQDMAYHHVGPVETIEPKSSASRTNNVKRGNVRSSASGGAAKQMPPLTVLTGEAKLDWEEALATAGFPKSLQVRKSHVLTCEFVTAPVEDGDVELEEVEVLWAKITRGKFKVDEKVFGRFWRAFDALFEEEEDSRESDDAAGKSDDADSEGGTYRHKAFPPSSDEF